MATASATLTAGRRTATVAGPHAWTSLIRTLADPPSGELRLSGHQARPSVTWPDEPPEPREPGGLCFDAGWVFHGEPERGQIARAPWPRQTGTPSTDLLPHAAVGEDPAGFRSPHAGLPNLRAQSLAVDADHHLFVLDGATGSIAILDLLDGRLWTQVTAPHAPPVDLTTAGPAVIVAVRSRTAPVLRADLTGTLRVVPIGEAGRAALAGLPDDAAPTRVALDPTGRIWLLLVSDTSSWIVQLTGAGAGRRLRIPGAADLEFDRDGALVVAGPAGRDLRVFDPSADLKEGVALAIKQYDGRGIIRTPEGRVGGWTEHGFRTARPYRRSYLALGSADAVALDSHTPRQVWGRVFVEACVPPGTRLEVAFASSEDAGVVESVGSAHGLHRRETGREVPWAPLPRGDRYEVYECPVVAPPGRYLTIRVHLQGTATLTPRVRALRVECESHGLLDQLPRIYREDPVAASSLRRYLAMVDGQLRDLEWRAVQRDRLLEPSGAPAELLPWLASLIGLSLDGRWSERARRTLLTEAIWLLRTRGTLAGLRRVLEIYTEAPVTILEAFRVKGYGGAFVGDSGSLPGPASAVVGQSFRVGGTAGTADDPTGRKNAFETHAHRFTVLVCRDLCGDERAVIRDLLDLHRPAHTLVEVCDTSEGMRVGMSLHIELSTVVSRDAAYSSAVVGQSDVGTGAVVGRGHAGIRPGITRLGDTTVVDP